LGDAAFAEHADRQLQTLLSSANILLLASHYNEAIKRFCNRAHWLQGGNLMMDGDPQRVLAAHIADEQASAREPARLPQTQLSRLSGQPERPAAARLHCRNFRLCRAGSWS
jgi:lipopolysaccharide transport system ATP-binding protein